MRTIGHLIFSILLMYACCLVPSALFCGIHYWWHGSVTWLDFFGGAFGIYLFLLVWLNVKAWIRTKRQGKVKLDSSVEAMKNNEVIYELCNELGYCSGNIATILEDGCQLKEAQLDYAILENFAFLLAYLHYEDGLSRSEVLDCISCFVGVNIGTNIEKFQFISRSTDFYSKILFSAGKGGNFDFMVMSKIIYNLLHPGERNNFTTLPIMNFIDVVDKGEKIRSFLSVTLPQRINPILIKL